MSNDAGGTAPMTKAARQARITDVLTRQDVRSQGELAKRLAELLTALDQVPRLWRKFASSHHRPGSLSSTCSSHSILHRIHASRHSDRAAPC